MNPIDDAAIIHLGPYRVTFATNNNHLPAGKCVIFDTRTGEGGTFDETATIASITDALDQFFFSNY